VTLKVLIVSDRPDFRQLLAHHVTLEWRDALPAEYEPTTRGRLQPGFTGAAYDAVLLDQEVQGGRGLEWLEDLVERRDCPAIVYFAADIDDDASTRARECGRPTCSREASSVTWNSWRRCARWRCDAQRPRRNLARRARAASPDRFGSVRIRGHRCLRRIAVGGSSSVFLAECVATGRQRYSRSSARFRTWSREARPSSASCASTTSSRTSTTEHRAHLRHRRRRRPPVPGDGVLCGRRPARANARAAAVAHGARLPAPAGRGARRAARDRRAAPGRQAGQHPAARGRQPGLHRLRSRAPAGARERHHRQWCDLRHATLHEPGAGPRAAARRAQRPLQPRRRALRDADRREAVRRRNAARGDLPSRQRTDSALAGGRLASATVARRAARQVACGAPATAEEIVVRIDELLDRAAA